MRFAGVAFKGMARTTVHRSIAALVMPLLFCSLAPQAQRDAEKDTTAMVQANFIYNIAKMVEWKDPSMLKGNFVIGVMGGSNLYQELIKKYATKAIGKQPIEVRKLPRSADVPGCQILFIGRTELAMVPEVIRRLEGRNTLIITEYPDALEDGAVVNFVPADQQVEYELSMINARKHGLQVGAMLKNLAYRVVE